MGFFSDNIQSFTNLRNLLLNYFSPLPNAVVSGGTITVTGNNVAISAVGGRINGVIYNGTYPGATLLNSAPGLLRYVAWYINTSSQVVKIEGAESTTAMMPNIPDNTALIGYVIVNDAGVGVPQVDIAQYVTKYDFRTFLDTAFSSFKALIKTTTLTANRVHTLQNKSGTLAHLDDIKGGRTDVDPVNPAAYALFIEPAEQLRRIYYGSPAVTVSTINFQYSTGGIENIRGIGLYNDYFVYWGGATFGFTRTSNSDMRYSSGDNNNLENKGRHLFYVSDGSGTYNANLLVAAINRKGLTAKSLNLQGLNVAPASATATGTEGEIRITADYIYVCTAANTWKRTPLTSW